MNFLQKLKKAFGGAAAEERSRAEKGELRFRNAMMEMEWQNEMAVERGVEAGVAHAKATAELTAQAQASEVKRERVHSVIQTIAGGTPQNTSAPKTAHFKRKSI